MGRTLKRVPLDFDHPLNEVWPGYLLPDRLHEHPCPDCKNGYSSRAQELMDRWYGNAPFDPADTGSTPFTASSPAVRALAERHVGQSPDYYGTGEAAIVMEARRLAGLYNSMWCHHLDQDDVNALVEADRLWEFTRTWSTEERWQKIEPPVTPTAAEVNEWSVRGLGHDSINASVVVRARCEREGVAGVADTCATCDGYASLEAYEGQRADAEAWEPTEPPEGEGYQLWETTSEGSPVSPVFASIEELCEYAAEHCTTFGSSKASAEGWRKMLDDDFVAATAVIGDGSTAIFL